jgi:two-component system, cell cycle response regulator
MNKYIDSLVNDKPVVLIYDEDITLLMYLRVELEKQKWGVLTTTDLEKAVSYFYELDIDCFLTALHIPNKNGFQIIESVRQKNNKQFIPIMVISSDTSKETRLKAYDMGADDFLTKPLDMEELIIRMNRQINRKKLFDKLLLLDELTGAFNRKYLKETLEKHRLELMRTNRPFCVVMVDIDFFKQVNDQYGHLVGDKVLTRFVDLVKARIRSTDSLFRYGGEEFTMILPNTRERDAKTILDRLLEEFSQITFEGDEGLFQVSFSAGLVEVTCPGENSDVWLKQADQALYAAKTSGKKKIEIADRSWGSSVKRKISIAILDDDPIIRMMLSGSLKHLFGDYMETDIRMYRDGESFFEDSWHQGNEPYIILLDVIMPRMDGMKVLERLRALPTSKQYTIVMLTGRSSEQDIARAMHMGVDDYMTKPFSVEELQIRIKRLAQKIID